MQILIYGAGNNGKLVLELLKKEYRVDCDIVGYIDSAKCGEYQGYPIYKLEDISDFNGIFIIAIADYKSAKEVCDSLKCKGYNDIYWFADKKLMLKHEDFFIEQCTYCRYWAGSILPQVEMHIMDSCNLNCRGCSHYSPIFPDTLPSLQDRLSDVRKLKEKFSHIIRFFILGGEPFLNPEINDYIQGIRSILPQTELYIVTNGLLLLRLDEEILKCIKRNHVKLDITEYAPTHKIIGQIRDRLDSFEIMYGIRKMESKLKFSLPLTLSTNTKYEKVCISDGCVTIWNGKIARCPQLMYLPYFNSYFNTQLPEEGTMALDACSSGDALLEELMRDVPLCKHCIKSEIEWSVCGKNAKVEDFAAYD